jgi:hypothetical protein
MSIRAFTTFDIKNILGLKIDRQKDWLTREYITPSIQVAKGDRKKNLFSQSDLYLVALFKYLVEKKYARRFAASIIRSIKYAHDIAVDSDRIRKTKLNAPGLADLKNKWMNLDDIDFLIVSQVPNPKEASRTQNLPLLVDAIHLKPAAEHMIPPIDWGKYENVDDIIIINFKKIREKVKVAIEIE